MLRLPIYVLLAVKYTSPTSVSPVSSYRAGDLLPVRFPIGTTLGLHVHFTGLVHHRIAVTSGESRLLSYCYK